MSSIRMLQILDDGRLTDGQGRTVSFKNTVIVMTSNVGTSVIARIERHRLLGEPAGADTAGRRAQAAAGRAAQTFRPEFLNRVDDIIVFNSLSKEHLAVIIDLQLQRVEKMLEDAG